MKKAIAHDELLRHLTALRHNSCDLRSKMTCLILYVEETESLSHNEKNCIINIVQTVAEKVSALISSEDYLARAINLLLEESNSGQQVSFSLFEEEKYLN